MPAAHTAIPRVQSDALAVLAAPGGYPATLVQLARLALASASGHSLPQRTRDTARIRAPRRPALRLIAGGRA